MTPRQSRSGCGCGLVLLLIAFLVGTLFLAVVAVSSSYDQRISVHDTAHVLKAEQIEQQSSDLAFNISVYTTRSYTYAHDGHAFRKYVEDQQNIYKDGLALGIETSSGTMLVEINRNHEVEDVFTSTLHSAGGDFTQATIAAILKLKQVYDPGPPSSWLRSLGFSIRGITDRVLGPANTYALFTVLAAFFLLLIVLVLVLYFFSLKRVNFKGGGSPNSRTQP